MDKYDRQIRLWASSGQRRLQDSHVCLLNATATGTEVLKNLVLPGIGAFTVVDGSCVQSADLSGNFFLDNALVGRRKAAAVCEMLLELNPDVQGHFFDVAAEEIILRDDFFAPFTAVVASGHIKELRKLKELLWHRQIPLLVVHAVGFYGAVRVFSKETTIIETHDPSKTYDLRIDTPWPELREFASLYDMLTLDATDHAHVPYIVIFIKALDRWRHDRSKVPLNYAEKKLFRTEYVQAMARDFCREPNFMEASLNVHRALQVTCVPDSVLRLFERDQARNIGPNSPVFWLLVHALRSYTEMYGSLPLPGKLPDMTSTTADYVKLRAIYREKAQKDRENFGRLLENTCKTAGRSGGISDALVAAFCKNCAFLYETQGSMQDFSCSMVHQLRAQLGSDSCDNLVVYFALLAYSSWCGDGKTGGLAGYMQAFSSLLREAPDSPGEALVGPAAEKVLQEVFRHSTSLYHNTCSLVGGVAAQELLKILTWQYIPLDDLFVYDGIRSTSQKWKV